jgi:hypothetical protein
MHPLRFVVCCLRGAVEAMRQVPPSPPPEPAPGPPPLPVVPRAPRLVKWLWAAGVTGAVVAEIAATSTGPFAEILRGFLNSAGAPVRERGPGGAAEIDCKCDCRGENLGGTAVESGAGEGTPADQGIARPSPRP